MKKEKNLKPVYEAPKVYRLDETEAAYGESCRDGSAANRHCMQGQDAGQNCQIGNTPGGNCAAGNNDT